ncbi:MAG TPA: zinc ribbon domain-containing protein [Thermoflexia bacterium]|nr:zinc ribbon domain-containing protein [Thermoflexia bacterium]
MPLYEYKCNECGLRFERRQRFSEPPVKSCPECAGEVIRLIQPAGIIFKGSGFYVTDNRAKSSTALPGDRQTKDKSKVKSAESSSDSSSKTNSDSTSPATDSE